MKKILCILCLLMALVCVLAACDTEEEKEHGDNELAGNLQQELLCANGQHAAGDWTETPATCTKGVIREKKCAACGVVLESEESGKPLGHVEGDWETVVPTCTLGAGRQKKCTRCSAVVQTETVGAPLGHDAEWEIVKQPTATQVGSKSRVCARCNCVLQTVELGKLNLDVNGRETDDLDQYNLNYSGEMITILFWADVERPEFEQKEITGDNIRDAIYDRNNNVEDRLNVDLIFVPMYAAYGEGVMDEFLRKIDAVRLAQSHDYDIIATYSRTEASLAVRGHLQNFSKIEESYMDLEKPWYPQSLVETVTFGDGSYYFISGDMSTNTLWMMHCIFLNEGMVSDLRLADPYQMVRSGNWTIDEMIRMTENLWIDVDNNKRPSVEDQIGFCALNYVCDSFYPGSNMRYFVEDDDALLRVSADYTSAKAVSFVNKLGEWASGNAIWITNSNSDPDMANNTRNLFKKGKTLMWFEHFTYTSELRWQSFEYGLLPTPKYDTNQKNYYTGMGHPWTLYGIFVDLDTRGDRQETLSMMTAVLECYSSEAYRLTTPEIYEVSMVEKYGEDRDATEMYEYIRGGVTFDLGKIFSVDTGNLPEQASNAIVDHTSWSSKYKSFLPAAEARLAALCADFRDAQLAGN